jgi:hypothetical protein
MGDGSKRSSRRWTAVDDVERQICSQPVHKLTTTRLQPVLKLKLYTHATNIIIDRDRSS